MDNIKQLRAQMKQHGMDAYMLSTQDEFLSEYSADHFRRLEWLTGFAGSNGMIIVTQKKVAFFTDGRYTLQASKQLGKGVEIFNLADSPVYEWVAEQLGEGQTLACNLWLHSAAFIEGLEKGGVKVVATDDLIGEIWTEDRPAYPASPPFIHSIKYSGQATEEKIESISSKVKGVGAEGLFIAQPENVCWLLNIRGNDVPHTPLFLCYALLNSTGEVTLFVDESKLAATKEVGVEGATHIFPISQVEEVIKDFAGASLIIDPSYGNAIFFHICRQQGVDVIKQQDPVTLEKACKSEAEIAGMIACHERDGVSLCKFLYWLEARLSVGEAIDEWQAAHKLTEIRSEGRLYQGDSFDTISGFAAHGAIVHYRVEEKTAATLKEPGIFLLDSGAQYLDGTTDVTRTTALGEPTKEQRRRFTQVLKGHISIATARFPKGTKGQQLDVLARKALWQDGVDYDHGTGHGVGSYLSVHEGPQGIHRRSTQEILPGMVLSNEPGYYKEGEYGIRIESLVLAKPVKNSGKGKEFIEFQTLTVVPIDLTLIDKELLTQEEKEWLNHYHEHVHKTLKPLLNSDEYNWLAAKTAAI